uniref:Uncharacterized protein n=1 Tax=Babesia bovis TaxID=5865 RepID=S6BMW4_BABBO|nr:conserved hypothetical protein [Babesia bovis]
MDPNANGVPPPLPSNEREWRMFERQYGRWLKDNASTITRDEGDMFRKATYSCLGLGVSAGLLINMGLSKVNIIKKPASRRMLSVFTAFYFTALCINQKRRPLYNKLLSSPGSLGVAARKILNDVRRIPPVSENGYTTEVPPSGVHSTPQTGIAAESSATYDNFVEPIEPFFTDSNSSISQENNKRTGFDQPSAGPYKTWDDIRRENVSAEPHPPKDV